MWLNNSFIEIHVTFHKMCPFKVYSSVVFSITVRVLQLLPLISEHFITQRETPYPLLVTLYYSLPPFPCKH